MPAKRLLMRKLRKVLQLKHEGFRHRDIGRACGMSAGSVSRYLDRARAADLTWPLPDDLDDGTLEGRMFSCPGPDHRPRPDLLHLHQELRRRELKTQVVDLTWVQWWRRRESNPIPCEHGFSIPHAPRASEKADSRLLVICRSRNSGH